MIYYADAYAAPVPVYGSKVAGCSALPTNSGALRENEAFGCRTMAAAVCNAKRMIRKTGRHAASFFQEDMVSGIGSRRWRLHQGVPDRYPVIEGDTEHHLLKGTSEQSSAIISETG